MRNLLPGSHWALQKEHMEVSGRISVADNEHTTFQVMYSYDLRLLSFLSFPIPQNTDENSEGAAHV